MIFNLVLLGFMVNQSGAFPVPLDKFPESEAQYYLASFGYLDPELKNSSTSSVSAGTVRNAVSEFQSFFGLDPTGIVNEETLTWMRKPRCGLPDRDITKGSSTRRKRRIDVKDRWTKGELTYGIRKHTPDLDKSVVDREIAKAFRLWEEVIPLTFTFVETGNVDIDISFESGSHSDSKDDTPFKGPGEVLAHAFFPQSGGDVHFDEAETWTISSDGTNLFQLATHEFGHALGLAHFESKTDVMFPTFEYRPDFKLEPNDINRIQQLYGINNKWLKYKLSEIADDAKNLKNELKATKKELEEAKVTIENLKTTLNARTRDIKNNDGKMPTSCEDLELMGQKINGIFLVKGTKATIDTVFCDFNPNSNNEFQKWIGHTEVKSAPVYFYVQRNSPFYAFKDAIPFDFARVNIGDAIRLQTGIFTAPKSGTYFFSFTGLASFPESKPPEKMQLGIGLYKNGDRVGRALAEESNTVDNQKCPLSLQSTLKLETNDDIWLQIDVKSTPEVSLFDDAGVERDEQWTHFTGWILQEEFLESH
ncbi:uncharacterized protein LOC124316241 isoform X4 [Daphnia pulicaria]|uniref:uncharacterized protein LOC124316241 isoform X4 n=1 Tax=Daphnia pulicaria TaxID=35523 RepID=UPI001EEB8EED|nr:uncharacterized protein LOC124316241 isoform X4 [Daphnia pulicaria]